MNILETNLIFKELSLRTKTERFILHHSACNSCTAEQIHQWHLNNGWSGAGYHFLVRKNGSIYRLRPEGTVGAHAYGSNYNSIGICAEGNFMEEEMQDVQKNAIIELVNYLKQKYNLNTLQKHSEVCATSCPGIKYPFESIKNEDEQVVLVPDKNILNGNVAKIQTYLNSNYGVNIAVDNIYGNETKKALIKALQTELNRQFNKCLVVDGIFGVKTKSACINVKKGAKGNITYLIQSMLVCHSFGLVLDGVFGPNTENAVIEFQSRNGITNNGVVDPNTFYILFK